MADAPSRTSGEATASWMTGPRAMTLVAVLSTLVAAMGVAVIVFSVTREEPTELRAGVLIILLATANLLWAIFRRDDPRPLLFAIALFVQMAMLLYYYYSGFARDARTYHRAALDVLDPDSSPPARLQLRSSEWSNGMVVQITALIYRVTGPSMMAGFVVFATASVTAKLIFATTVLRLRPIIGRMSDIVALAVVAYPSLALWLSPIGKEVPSVLGIALVIAGVVRLPGERPRLWLIALGLAMTGTTRPHVAMLLGAGVVAFGAASALLTAQSFARRVAILVGAAVLAVGSLQAAANFFDVDASPEGLSGVRDNLADTDDDGGSSIEARPIRSPIDVPIATTNVLIRPWPFEASGLTGLMQSFESMLVLLLVLWIATRRRFRRSNRVTGLVRRHIRTLRVFAITYSAGFVYAFSGMYNLGLMSRQRTQFTLILLLLLALSMVSTKKPKPTITAPLRLAQPASGPEPHAPGSRGPLVLATLPPPIPSDQVAPDAATGRERS